MLARRVCIAALLASPGDLDAAFVVDSKSTLGLTGAAPDVEATHAEYKFVGPRPPS